MLIHCWWRNKSHSASIVHTENESVPIQLTQCRFPGLTISNAKILIYFSNEIYGSNFIKGWLGNRVVSVLDSGTKGLGFKSQPRRCRVTVFDKLFTPIVPLFTKQQNW